LSLDEPTPGSYFPSNENSHIYAKRLGGYDLYKSSKTWMALVAIEDQYGKKSIKWYRWQKRMSVWKNTLCNMKIDYLDFILINEKIQILKKKFDVSDDSSFSTQGNNDHKPDDDSSIQIDEGNGEEIPPYYKYKGYADYDGNFDHCEGNRK